MIRKATVNDVKQIFKLVNYYAKKNRMLPRSFNELYENVRDFVIYLEGKTVYGCSALHVDWDDLGEIKSLAVAPSRIHRGIGTRLLRYCLGDAKQLKLKKVFALTYIPEFFEQFGFKLIDKQNLPHKIWSECIKCIHFPDCSENALLKEL